MGLFLYNPNILVFTYLFACLLLFAFINNLDPVFSFFVI